MYGEFALLSHTLLHQCNLHMASEPVLCLSTLFVEMLMPTPVIREAVANENICGIQNKNKKNKSKKKIKIISVYKNKCLVDELETLRSKNVGQIAEHAKRNS